MEEMIEKACGIDVHKETVVACVKGKNIRKEIRTFTTMTRHLLEMREWLKERQITHIAIESTGIYWKPVFNILEDDFQVILANARHVKNVPRRKTDVCDSEWLCDLLRCGLIKGSFIPPKDIRELRDLTRYRKKLVHNITAEKNRVQKILEDANIKLSSVVSDVFGVSGLDIINALIEGEKTVEEMSDLARSKLRAKKDIICESLLGNLDGHHKFLLTASLEHIKYLESTIYDIDTEVNRKMAKYDEQYKLLQTIPGVKEHSAASIIAEIGVDMDRFPTEAHLSAWAGVSPGNNESAGKKKACGVTFGNNWLKAVLVECGWAATRHKNTYLRAKYNSLIGRRGKKRALVAIGHKILIICYYILKCKVPYKELGLVYLEEIKKDKIVRSYAKRLNKLGYCVIKKEEEAA